MKAQRFTVDGDWQLEGKLTEICDQVRTDLFSILPLGALEGILLGGGYGRGEGGVLKCAQGDQIYNDLEFYVLLRGNCRWNERRYGTALRNLSHSLSAPANAEVEFKILSRRKLQNSPITMGYYDLVTGHRLLWGTPNLLSGCDHHCRAPDIPLAEATRLLMNRCSGLLFAQAKLQSKHFTSEDADFVGRNQAKAQLAFGDAILTAFGQYHASCRERHHRLLHLTAAPESLCLEQVRRHHEAGVQFKLHPSRSTGPPEAFLPQQCALVEVGRRIWLWLENRRLKRSFVEMTDYAADSGNKCPETATAKNLLINLRQFGFRCLLSQQALRYPRERLFNSLALLLWAPETLKQGSMLKRVQKNLCTRAQTHHALVEAYQMLWRQFN